MTDQLFTDDELKPDLPPPGAERREVLAERKDTLEQKAEEIASEQEITSVPKDHKALQPDRELQYQISENYLEVSDPKPGYMYKWVNYVSVNGQKVWEAKANHWEVVTGGDGESSHLLKEDGTRRVGDVILVRRRMDIHLIMERKEEQKRLKRELAAEGELRDIAAKSDGAFTVHDAESNPAMIQKVQKRAAAHRVAAQTLGNKMKSGTIPGVPIR